MDRKGLDNICEKGILGLVLAILVFSVLATGAVRTLEFLAVQFMTIAVGLLWLARFWLNPRQRLLFPPVGWAVLAFLAYAAWRYGQADVEYVARQEWVHLLVYSLLFFVILNILYKAEWTQLTVYVLVFLGMAIAIYAIIQVILNSDQVWHFSKPDQYHGRGSGTFINPNHMANWLAVVLPLGLAVVLVGRVNQNMRILLAYACLMILGGLATSMSRGGWIACGLGLLTLLGILARRRQFRIPVLAVLTAAVIAAGGFFFKSDFAQERLQRAATPGNQAHMASRLDLWKPAIDMWLDNKWTGVGPGHYDIRFPEHRPDSVQARPVRVHNDYLNTLVDWGAAGFGLAALATLTLALGVVRSWKYSKRTTSDLSAKTSNRSAYVLGAVAGLVAFAAHEVVDFNGHIPSNAILVTTLAALLAAFIRFATEHYWITPRLPLRLTLTVMIGGMVLYLGGQGWTRGLEYFHLRQSQAANDFFAQTESLEKALQAEPKNPETAGLLGEIYRRQAIHGGDADLSLIHRAMGWLEHAGKLNPYDATAASRYGMCLDHLGRIEKAAKWFERARKLDPNGYITVAHVAWHRMQAGDFPGAKVDFKRAQELMKWRSEKTAQDLARHINSIYLPYIEERLREK